MDCEKDPNNPIKEYTGVWIPAEVMECEELTPTEKMAYGEIACFNICYASNAWLAKRLGKGEETARKSVSKLISLGFVENCGFNGRFRQIRVVKNYQTGKKLPGRLVKNYQADWSKITTIDKSIEQSIEVRKKERKKTYDDVFKEKQVDGELREAFVEFIRSRDLNKKKMTDKALALAIDKVRKLEPTEEKQIEIINQSIERGWQGLFPLSASGEKGGFQIINLNEVK